ncbi:hypothetical protein LPJ66_006810 [Kickxella alabastrina]|uniref:Uncharacterized protein n=1 Tax=Kickxella alabastrina TaxID=61397 RepID=A0ACC1IBC5_9FUNG|nr:hypothetical protein LPJ66_006810 [Kickxella alabastrina]
MPTAEAFLGVLPFNLKITASPIPRNRNQNQGTSLNDRFSRLFKYRSSKVVAAETNQQRTRVDRTCISEYETQYLQQRSTKIILQNDFVLAKTLCQLDVSGDRAAMMASHLVSFLRGNPQTADHVERFVMDAFDVHLKKYSALAVNARNVLRDNNLATMLVVCYLQQSCRNYLVSILQPVMMAIGPFVESCELDPVRLPPGADGGSTARNSYNLYCVCRSVLDAVFSAGKHAPVEMRRLCALIRSRIEGAWDTQMPALSTPVSATRKYVQKQKDSKLPILELRDWETELKSNVRVDIMSDIKAALDEWLDNPKAAAAITTQVNTQAHAHSQKQMWSPDMATSPASSGGSKSHNKASGSPWTPSTEDIGFSGSYQSMVNTVSSPFLNFLEPGATPSASGGKNTKVSQSRIPAAKELKDSWRQTQAQSPRKNMSPSISMRLSKHSSKRYSGSYFSSVETVISMLIFVRFFIPILTAPDAYGIDVRMSPANRRGLLLCAKVLAVLCNGVSFGMKEPYLMPMNGLIREYRPKLRSYLQAISASINHPAEDDDECDEHVSDDECSDRDTVTIDELASQFKVVTVGAKIATKEEQRKSRMSFSRAAYLNSGSLTPDTLERDFLSELPMPMPSIPQQYQDQIRQQQQARQQQQQLQQTLGTSAHARPPATRSTIDLPTRVPISSLAPADSLFMMDAVAVSTSASDSLVDNEVIDESLVTIDFLISLEGNFTKLESYVDEHTFSMLPAEHHHLQAACRELKPIVHYAKHLSKPGKMQDTFSIATTSNHNSQDQARRHDQHLAGKKSQEVSHRFSEDFVDLGHRRTSTMPGKFIFD